jgi:PAS domain-containing protein
MSTTVAEAYFPDSHLAEQTLHHALCRAHPYGLVAADTTGRIIEWNAAAESLTGIAREDALAGTIWDICSGVAPAVIPYEIAVRETRDVFLRLLDEIRHASTQGVIGTQPSARRFTCNVLSTTGELREVRFDCFPVWFEGEPVLCGCVIPAEPAQDDGSPPGEFPDGSDR